MNAGRLRHRIVLEAPNKVKDTSGGYKTTYVIQGVIWADIQPLRGSKLLEAKQITTEINHVIKIRYRENIKTDWRILYKDRIFLISSIVNVYEQNKMIELYCTEKSNGI